MRNNDAVLLMVAIHFLIESKRTDSVKCVGGVTVKPQKTTILLLLFFVLSCLDRTEAETVNNARLFSSTQHDLT